jgi:predicted nucleic acid-binding protein
MGKRRFRILDTNVLINFWIQFRLWQRSEAEVRAFAQRLIQIYNTDLIASPVRIEFLCGITGSNSPQLWLTFIQAFKSIDEGNVPRADWHEAERIAKRVARHGRPRKLGDCLLKAIALRLNCDIVTADADFERRVLP